MTTPKSITESDIRDIGRSYSIEYAMLRAFIDVESGGYGFDLKRAKYLFSLSRHGLRKKAPFAPSGAWSFNKVDVQRKEWQAFNSAFALNPEATMESTSWGMPQIMGFHWQRLRYTSVGQMVDDFKKGEYFQILALARFIKTDDQLYAAMRRKDFTRVAELYNGNGFREIAKKYKREPYDLSMEKAYKKWLVKN